MKLREYFIHDDGSLPDLFINNCDATVLELVYRYLDGNNHFSGNNIVWSNELERDVPLNEIENPILALKQGTIESFHFMVSQLTIHEVELPLLGVMIGIDSKFSGNIIFDYRMGSEWTDEKINAFLCLVSSIEALSPDIEVKTDGWDNEYKEIKSSLKPILLQ